MSTHPQKSESNKNNSNPQRRRLARAKVKVSPEAMARWPLLAVIADAMAPTGEYSPETLSKHRTAVRTFEKFIGFEQSPATVTESKFEEYYKWLMDRGYEPSTAEHYCENVAAVVRFADCSLLPSRQSTVKKIYADAEVAGSIESLLVNEYFPVSSIASDDTKRHYGYAVRRLSQFLGRPATCADLSDETMELWFAQMQAAGLKPVTIKGYGTDLNAFWKWAVTRRLVRHPASFGR